MKDQHKTQTHFIPTSQLKLYNVVNDQGEDLGQVQNFIVDMCSMRVAYVLVAFEGFLGLGDKWIPMPFEALAWMPEKNRFKMDISRKTLEKAPTITKSEWPDKFLAKLEVRDHAAWLESVYTYYNRTPYWVEYNPEPCGTETTQPVMVETVTTYVYAEPGGTDNMTQLRSASAATAAAREALKSATKSEEASIEAKAAKDALAEACAAANKAGEIAKANNEASTRATRDARSAEELARKSQEAAHVARKATDEATASAGEAIRRVETAAKKAEDTARAAEEAAGEDSIKAEEAAQVAKGAALTATKAFEQSGTCE